MIYVSHFVLLSYMLCHVWPLSKFVSHRGVIEMRGNTAGEIIFKDLWKQHAKPLIFPGKRCSFENLCSLKAAFNSFRLLENQSIHKVHTLVSLTAGFCLTNFKASAVDQGLTAGQLRLVLTGDTANLSSFRVMGHKCGCQMLGKASDSHMGGQTTASLLLLASTHHLQRSKVA